MNTTKSFRKDRLITEGPLTTAIWKLSWPLMIRMAAVSLASFTDIWIAGKLGSDTQAAIGICAQIWFFLLLITIALSAGTTAMVSRYWGAGDRDNAVEAARHSLAFAVAFGMITIVLGLTLARPILRLLGTTAAVEAIAWDYIQIDIFSQLPFTVVWIAHAIMRASGDTVNPMINWVIMTALIITLDLLFCLGPPALGVKGIALAWLISACVGIWLSLSKLAASRLAPALSKKRWQKRGFSQDWLKRFLAIGMPACVSDLTWSLGCFALFFIFSTTPHPTECQASWAIGLRIEEILSYMPIYALATACATIVGQNLGAGKNDRAQEAGWLVLSIGVGATTLIALILFLGAERLASFLSKDALVVEYARQYFQVIGLSQPFVAIWIILFGAMQGAGYTRWTMWVSIAGFILFRLPIAWTLTGNISEGPLGCWIAFALTSVVLGLLCLKKFNSRDWQLQTV